MERQPSGALLGAGAVRTSCCPLGGASGVSAQPSFEEYEHTGRDSSGLMQVMSSDQYGGIAVAVADPKDQVGEVLASRAGQGCGSARRGGEPGERTPGHAPGRGGAHAGRVVAEGPIGGLGQTRTPRAAAPVRRLHWLLREPVEGREELEGCAARSAASTRSARRRAGKPTDTGVPRGPLAGRHDPATRIFAGSPRSPS